MIGFGHYCPSASVFNRLLDGEITTGHNNSA
jgi:hypothetical protein